VAGAVPSAIELALDPRARMQKRADPLGEGLFDISGDKAFADLLDKQAEDGLAAVKVARASVRPARTEPSAVEKLAEDAVLRQTMAEAFALVRGEEPDLNKTAAVLGYGLSAGFNPEQIQAVFEKSANGGDFWSRISNTIAPGGNPPAPTPSEDGGLGLAAAGTAAMTVPVAHYGLQRKFRNLPQSGLAGNLRRYMIGLTPSEQAATSQTELARQQARAEAAANDRLQALESQRRMVAAQRQGPAALSRANRIADLEGMGGLSRLEAERYVDREMQQRGMGNALRARKQLGIGEGVANVSVNGLAMPVNYRRAIRATGPAAGAAMATALLMRGRHDDDEEDRRPVIRLG
jgi:hypothetical protein